MNSVFMALCYNMAIKFLSENIDLITARCLVEEKKTFLAWVKEHKTELLFIGVTAVSTVLVAKNWHSLKGIFESSKPSLSAQANPRLLASTTNVPVISDDILKNLTGNKMTATELGSRTLCSAQAINKRIVKSGLATKLPCGDYLPTEAGRLVGESTLKTTWAGYSFSNNEWDEKIIEVLFSAEELLEIANKKRVIQEILGGSVA